MGFPVVLFSLAFFKNRCHCCGTRKFMIKIFSVIGPDAARLQRGKGGNLRKIKVPHLGETANGSVYMQENPVHIQIGIASEKKCHGSTQHKCRAYLIVLRRSLRGQGFQVTNDRCGILVHRK